MAMSGCFSFIFRVTSRPFCPGSPMSIKTRRGLNPSSFCMASSPSPASLMAMDGNRTESSSLKNARNSRLSSTSNTSINETTPTKETYLSSYLNSSGKTGRSIMYLGKDSCTAGSEGQDPIRDVETIYPRCHDVRMVVPAPLTDSMRKVPPESCVRSFIPASPSPLSVLSRETASFKSNP